MYELHKWLQYIIYIDVWQEAMIKTAEKQVSKMIGDNPLECLDN